MPILSILHISVSCQSPKFSKFVVPEFLTVSSSGPAGEYHPIVMGVYSLTEETYANKPVWSNYDGSKKIYYSLYGKFKL